MGRIRRAALFWVFIVLFNLVLPGITSATSSDFNHDGTADILFQNSSDGRLLIWVMNDFAKTVRLPESLAVAWKVVGKGDFNGDGTADVLYMKDDGTTAIAEMSGAARTSLKFPGGINPVWSVRGVGDFNGDGTDDILWRRSIDGVTMVWGMVNSIRAKVSWPGGLASFWKVVGTGDFNGDRTDDILFQHSIDGRLLVWQMNNYVRTAVKFPSSIASSWQVVGVGDFDNDGTDDVLYRKDAGDTAIAEFTNLNRSALTFPGGLKTIWSVRDVGDYNGDGTDDILWRRSTDNITMIWGVVDSSRNNISYPGGLSPQWLVPGAPMSINLTLDGSDDVVVHELTSNPPSSFFDRSTFTIEAWVYPESNKDMLIVADSAYYLMIRGALAEQPLRAEFAVLTTTGFPAFQSFSGGPHPLKLNQWNHVVGMVNNTTRQLRVSVNGELPDPLTMGGGVDSATPQSFSIGNSYPDILGDYPFDGRIDSVRLSSVIRYSENFEPTPFLDSDGAALGLWRFDEAVGSTHFIDSSGYGQDLSGLGAITASAVGAELAEGSGYFPSVDRMTTGQTAGPVVIGDFNGDHLNDFAVAGVYNNATDKVVVYLGQGDGVFGPPSYYSLGQSGAHGDIMAADFNKDSVLDLATSNTSGSISVLLGQGDGSFASSTLYTVGSYPVKFASGDFNGDNNLDIATANAGADSVSVLLGNGDGSFGAATHYSVGQNPYDVAVGHFDANDTLDLAVTNQDDNSVTILLGTGTGTFDFSADFAVGNNPKSMVIGDFNRDNKRDIVTSNFNDGTVTVLLGDGAGAFDLLNNFTVGFGGPEHLISEDFNHDGIKDLAVASGGGNASFAILLGDGSGSFSTPQIFFTEENPLSLASGDLNNDQQTDLIMGVGFSDLQLYVARKY